MKFIYNILTAFLIGLFSVNLTAQNIEVTHQSNGTVLSVPVQSIDSVIFQLVPPPSMKNIYQSNGNVLSIAMDDVDSITYVIPNPSLLPQVSTGSPTVLSSSSVYVDGNVTADGGSPVSQRGFCWSLSPNPTIANNTSQNGTGLGSFNQTVQPLSPSTTYYIRAYATNTEGTAYGNQVILTTSQANSNGGIPIIQTELIVYNDGLTAISGGNITDDGGLAVTSRGVCWAIGTTPTINNSITNDGSGAGSFQSNLTGLQPGTSYFARAYATNDAGTAYGITYSFTTNELPVVNTNNAFLVKIHEAQCIGEILSTGGSNIIQRGICWSTNNNPTINDNFSTANNSSNPFSAWTWPYLDTNEQYFIRAYAISNVGISYGNVLTINSLYCKTTPTIVLDVVNPITGAIWMDRNLGAFDVPSNIRDVASYGDLYQWGRSTDGHQCPISQSTNILSSSEQPGHGEFIVPNSGSDWLSPGNNSLWQGVNGTNNPCPQGYRLPSNAELDAERLSWSQNNSAGAYASTLQLPIAGGRTGSSSGQSAPSSSYWTSTISGTNAQSILIQSNNAVMSSVGRYFGASIRCIKD